MKKKSTLILAISLLLLCCKSNNKKESNDVSPNVVLIVIDDLGYADMSITGLSKDVRTPNIDALAKSGTRFTNAYASSSICSPSRSGLITGSYQQRWGTFWYGGPGIKDSSYKTISELLKTKNYKTGYVGKVHYGSKDHDITNRSFPLNHGFDYFYGHTSAHKHYLNHVDSIENKFLDVKKKHKRVGQSLRQQAFWENKNKVDTVGFSTEIIGEKAIQFIKNNKNTPFFLQVSFNAVHNFTHQLPEWYLKEHNLKGYHDWNPENEDYYDWYKQGRLPNNPEGRAYYLGQLYFLDKEIGKLKASLREQGLLDNTLLVFVSDNGGSTPIYANNTPLKGSKYTLYEGGIRVPLIISYPKDFKEGKTSNQLVSAMDVLPTICETIGLNTPNNIDGKSLKNALIDRPENGLHHEYLVWDNNAQTAVKKGKWKYRTANDKAKHNSDYEMVFMEYGEFLYDLENDIGETTNVANQYPKVFNELKQIHRKWRLEIEKNK